MTQLITKAIIPAAGLGTRLLPATKAQPKEMLPVGRRPILQYVVEELEAAGLNQMLIITGRRKRIIEDHFDADPQLVTRPRWRTWPMSRAARASSTRGRVCPRAWDTRSRWLPTLWIATTAWWPWVTR